MLKKGTKVLCLILAVVMTMVLFAGCGQKTSDKSGSTSTTKKGYKFGFTVQTLDNPYFIVLRDALKASLKPGDQLIVDDCQTNEAKQINDIDDLIQQKCDVIFLNCVDSKGVKPALEACQKAKIPVVVVDTPVQDTDLVATVVASDNYKAGQLCGDALAKKIGEKGKVAMYQYTLNEVAKLRGDGFADAISKYPDIKIVNRQEGLGTIDAALPIMENILQSNPDINGMFALNDPSGIGCESAIKSAGKINQISIVSVDGSENVKKLIKSGQYLGTAAQFPAKIGQMGVDAAYKILAGQTVDKDIKVPVEFVDSSNVDTIKNN